MTPGRAGRPQRRRLVVGPAGRPRRRAAPAPTCSGTSKADRSPTCRRTPRRRTSTSTRSSEIQVTNGGGDVSVQSRGLSINLVTKSGSNVFKGSAVGTFENDAMQGEQRHARSCSTPGANGFLSGNPIKKIANYSVEYGGPIMKNRLWLWARGRQAGHQRRRRQLLRCERRRVLPGPDRGAAGRHRRAASAGDLRQARGRAEVPQQRQDGHQGPAVEVQLPVERREQVPVPVPERQQVPQRPRRQRRRRRRKRRRSRRATSRGACRCRRTRSRTR